MKLTEQICEDKIYDRYIQFSIQKTGWLTS